MRTGVGLDIGVIKPVPLIAADPVAPPYEEPVETPDSPPAGEPTPPTDTPTDPDTSEPEPGVDPDFAEATRIELADSKQTVIRTTAEPGNWGNAYVATEASGYDYWEVHVGGSTPVDSTLAVGVTNGTLPLNGIPGNLAESVAYWSSGVVRSSGSDTGGIPTFGRNDKIGIARDADTGRVWFSKNGVWIDAMPTVGGSGHQGVVTGAGPYFPFVALYSADARVQLKFVSVNFAYPVPSGFYPLGRTPEAPPPSTVSLVSSHIGNSSVTCPTVQAGDLLVFFELARNSTAYDPGFAVPSGFTNIVSTFSVSSRITMSRRLATGSEGGSVLSAMSGDSSSGNGHALFVFRGSTPITAVSSHDVAHQSTTGNPAAQVVNASGGVAPLIVLAGSYGVITHTTSWSPAADAMVDSGSGNLMAGYKIYNSSPQDVTVDIVDMGNANQLMSCYLQLTF